MFTVPPEIILYSERRSDRILRWGWGGGRPLETTKPKELRLILAHGICNLSLQSHYKYIYYTKTGLKRIHTMCPANKTWFLQFLCAFRNNLFHSDTREHHAIIIIYCFKTPYNSALYTPAVIQRDVGVGGGQGDGFFVVLVVIGAQRPSKSSGGDLKNIYECM